MTQQQQRSACQQVAKALAAAIKSRNITDIEAIYADEVTVWHNDDRKTQDRAENLAQLSGLFSLFSSLEYRDVRQEFTDDGFVQQHILTGILPDGRSMEIPVCLVARVSDNRISHIDEYFDPAPFHALMSQIG